MKAILRIYMDDYREAKRLANTLYRPAMDKADMIAEETWIIGDMPMVIERDTEIYYIYRR